ncbi:MAG TPA: ATP-binding protein [Blastocatellia bacterium]|nr:ATP-binding protein [Blastocatellia bacterium]
MNEENPLPIFRAGGALLPPAWEALFEAIEDGVCVQSLDSRIVRANSAFAVMIGLPLDEIIGRSCAEVFGCANETGSLPQFCARSASNTTGRVTSEEICGRQPGQRLRSRVSPVRDESGQVTAYVMVVRDITDVIARERELSRVEQLARFGELAAGLAHEIKNPLAGIQGAVDILIGRRSPNSPEREVLEGVRREVGRVDATVQALLERARPRGFNFQTASLTDAVQRAVSLARHQAAGLAATHGHQIRINFIPSAAPIVMPIDPAQIEDAVLNLLLNAIEAIDHQGSVTVRLCDRSPVNHPGPDGGTRNEVVIEVSDTGRGITDDNLLRIFSPFFTTQANGTGLGLPAVRRIVRAHGGQIEVTSAPGTGSTFTIRLPREIHPGQQQGS